MATKKRLTIEQASKIAQSIWDEGGYALTNNCLFHRQCIVGFKYGPMMSIMGRGRTFEEAFKSVKNV